MKLVLISPLFCKWRNIKSKKLCNFLNITKLQGAKPKMTFVNVGERREGEMRISLKKTPAVLKHFFSIAVCEMAVT